MNAFKFLPLIQVLLSSHFALMTSLAVGGGEQQRERPSQYYPTFSESLPSLAGKTVVITGCSRGLGYVTAKTVAKKGASVIMMNRRGDNANRAFQRLKQDTVTDVPVNSPTTPPPEHYLIECHLLSFESVRQACQEVKDLTTQTGGIHVLCNNAGIMLQPDEASKDGYDITASTNMLSHFLITRELLPSLEQGSIQKQNSGGERPFSRVINMSSASGYGGPPLNTRYFEKRGGNLGGSGTRASYERYHQSKLANLAFTCALHDRLQSTGKHEYIQVVACTPGVCGTDMFVHATTVMNGNPAPKSMVPSPEDGSMAQLKCIFDPHVKSGELWGPGRNGVLEQTPMEPPRILVDATSKAAIWEACEQAVGKFDLA